LNAYCRAASQPACDRSRRPRTDSPTGITDCTRATSGRCRTRSRGTLAPAQATTFPSRTARRCLGGRRASDKARWRSSHRPRRRRDHEPPPGGRARRGSRAEVGAKRPGHLLPRRSSPRLRPVTGARLAHEKQPGVSGGNRVRSRVSHAGPARPGERWPPASYSSPTARPVRSPRCARGRCRTRPFLGPRRQLRASTARPAPPRSSWPRSARTRRTAP